MNTFLEYLYRDASNYKQYQKVIFNGYITEASVRNFLWENEYFLPGPLGLRCLHNDFLKQGFALDFNEDHPWHEVIFIKPSSERPSINIHANEFLKGLEECQSFGWKKLMLKENLELVRCIRNGLVKN